MNSYFKITLLFTIGFDKIIKSLNRIKEPKMNAIFNSVKLIHPAPEVGMGGTMFGWSDRHAFTVSRVSPSGKTAWIVMDEETRTDKNGMSDCQNYSYAPGEGGEIKVRLSTNGQWYNGTKKSNKVAFGHRDSYYDYSF
jgi:hypothetical protein